MWRRLRQEFHHAFALAPTEPTVAPEEIALLEKIAALVVKRGMAAPAVLFLESSAPLNFLGSQMLHGLKPFLELVSDPTEMERLAAVLEQRDSIARLVALIQERVATNP